MADFSRDQDFLDVSPLSISQRHEPGLICTLPDFHERRSQYDIIGIPDFGNMDTSALTPGQLVPPAAASCTNYNILGNYKSLTHGLERSYGSNVHAGCFGDHDQSNVGMKEKWPRLPNPCELAYIHHPATLIASTPPNPTVVASDEKSNYNSQQQLAGRDCEPREGSTQNQCHNGLTDLKQSPPSSPKPGPDQLIGTESTECKKRKNNQFLGSGAGQERKELHLTPKEAKNRTKRFRSCSSSKCRKGSCSGNAESLSKAKQKPEPPTDYIHVRARRGQATDSHSLAERVRREKISERMKTLQDLVPGCNKVTGKAVVLDEIINYVQSLQKQVEFLSMKLASLNVSCDHFGLLDDFLEPSQGLLILQGSGSSTQPMTVYEAVAGNCIEGYRPLMQHQTPCALDAAFPAAMAGYNSLIYRPRST